MKYLSLFTGAGGGDLAMQHLLGFRAGGYVEIDKYCRRVIAQRIADGVFDEAPIFGDIRAFLNNGYARAYQGMVDLVTGGFPCQPFSTAGSRRGKKDERNLWSETLKCISVVRPKYIFLENVPGLLTSGYFGQILGGLVGAGYDCRWTILSAAEVGAPHIRKRLWLYGVNANAGSYGQLQPERFDEKWGDGVGNVCGDAPVSDTDGAGCRNVNCGRQEPRRNSAAEGVYSEIPNADGSGREKQRVNQSAMPARSATKCCSWWASERGVLRVAHGVANRTNRIRAAGNGQVPAVAAEAWRRLHGGGQ